MRRNEEEQMRMMPSLDEAIGYCKARGASKNEILALAMKDPQLGAMLGYVVPTELDTYMVMPMEWIENEDDPIIMFMTFAKIECIKKIVLEFEKLPVKTKMKFMIRRGDW